MNLVNVTAINNVVECIFSPTAISLGGFMATYINEITLNIVGGYYSSNVAYWGGSFAIMGNNTDESNKSKIQLTGATFDKKEAALDVDYLHTINHGSVMYVGNYGNTYIIVSSCVFTNFSDIYNSNLFHLTNSDGYYNEMVLTGFNKFSNIS